MAGEPLFNLARQCGRNRGDGTPQRWLPHDSRVDSRPDNGWPILSNRLLTGTFDTKIEAEGTEFLGVRNDHYRLR